MAYYWLSRVSWLVLNHCSISLRDSRSTDTYSQQNNTLKAKTFFPVTKRHIQVIKPPYLNYQMNKGRAIKLKAGSKTAKDNLLAENLWSSENLNFVNLNSVNSVNSSSSHKVDSCRFKKTC